jgi:hypothetical protein
MDDSEKGTEELEQYEAPELVTLCSVEEATLATPETVGSDSLLALSTT